MCHRHRGPKEFMEPFNLNKCGKQTIKFKEEMPSKRSWEVVVSCI